MDEIIWKGGPGMMKRIFAGLMMCIFTISLLPATVLAEATAGSAPPLSVDLDLKRSSIGYGEYLKQYEQVAFIAQERIIEGRDFTDAKGTVSLLDNLGGEASQVAVGAEDSEITWTFDAPAAGFYNILIEYFPVEGKGATIERQIRINGELPFDGADLVYFHRIWTNDGEITRDERDNDSRPLQKEAPKWLETYIQDAEGYYPDPYQFYFEQGTNTITLVAIKEPLAVRRIHLTTRPDIPTYQQLSDQYASAGYTPVNGQTAIPPIQGESAVYKSHSTLYPVSDRSSPLTQPYSPSKIRMNAIGGENWKMAGQWITWEFDAPESGLYQIGIKYRQNITSGLTVIRSLKIDGEYPFQEAREIPFNYKNDWQNMVVGGEDAPYLFYFEKGLHSITLEVGLGSELGLIIEDIENSVIELNKAYREMLVVIGSTPDSFRDYELEKKTPGALKTLEEQYAALTAISEKLKAYLSHSKGTNSSALDQLIYQVRAMYTDPESIAKKWSSFKDNIVALSSWALSMKEQPLEIDYLMVQAPGSVMPKAKASFWQKLIHETKAFLASFTEDYTSLGSIYGNEAPVVWVQAGTSGRDQAQVLKNMVDNDFTPRTGIPVNIQLVNGGILLSATLAGQGPDVALHAGGSDPVNYALRNAVADLRQFGDFEEVAAQFYDASLVPFEINGGVYALPETMSFPVMFYRADILQDLGVGIPQTWEEFYEAVSVIQKKNLDVGLPVGNAGALLQCYCMLLMQQGGQLYTDDGTSTALLTETAINAFQDWTALFSDYKLPVTYDFANRFRTGEMPLAIADYTQYNYLSVFAPEIKGLWGFTLVPGYKRDGGIDRTAPVSVSATILMEQSKKKESSWEFIKWWLSADAQQEYGNNLENILGVSGRLATANKSAMEMLPWSDKDIRVLKAQLEYVAGIPEIAGGYFTSRHINNAFYKVYNANENPRQVLEDYALVINKEITNKRKEFGLPAAE